MRFFERKNKKAVVEDNNINEEAQKNISAMDEEIQENSELSEKIRDNVQIPDTEPELETGNEPKTVTVSMSVEKTEVQTVSEPLAQSIGTEPSPDAEKKNDVLRDVRDKVKTRHRRVKRTVSKKAAQYSSDTKENKYRYVLTGVITLVVTLSLVTGIVTAVMDKLDQRIVKPGQFNPSDNHTPVFIDEESESIYYESGLFAPAVVEDFVKLKVGDIIYEGPVANLIKNNCPVFESAQELDGNFLLSFGVWEVLAEEFYSAGVTSIDNITYISYEVIDAAIKEYFEVEETPFHVDTLTQFGEFTADNKKQAYKAPSTGYEEQIMARVSAVDSEKKTTLASDGVTEQITTYVSLTLDCILSTDLENYEIENGAYPVAERQVLLSIRIDPDGSYKFTSLKIAGDSAHTGGEQQ